MPASAASYAAWEQEKAAGKSWDQVARENLAKVEAYKAAWIADYRMRTGGRNPPQHTVNLRAAQYAKTLPHRPPSGLQATLSGIAHAVIPAASLGVVASGVGSLASTAFGSPSTGSVVPELTADQGLLRGGPMGFFDDISGTFNQVSSLVSQGQGIVNQVRSFGNAGGTAQGPPAPQMQGPLYQQSGIPAGVWIVGGLLLLIVLYKK